VLAQKYETKLSQIDSIVKMLAKDLQSNKKQAKVNNSFCLGCDHSMLLKPKKVPVAKK
jgi:hypothetical protein